MAWQVAWVGYFCWIQMWLESVADCDGDWRWLTYELRSLGMAHASNISIQIIQACGDALTKFSVERFTDILLTHKPTVTSSYFRNVIKVGISSDVQLFIQIQAAETSLQSKGNILFQ